MAKLNGVKTLDMANGEITKVEYAGEVYTKVADSVKKGDIFKLLEGHHVIGGEVGAFYPTEAYPDGDVAIPTELNGNATYTQKRGWGVAFRKVVTDGFTLVTNRKPKAGDFVKFTDEDELPSYLTLGKYYEIEEIDFANDPQITDDDGDDFDAGGYEYDVYEKVSDKQTLKTEKRVAPLKVGDYAKVVKLGGHNRKIGEIIKLEVSDGSAIPYECGTDAFYPDQLVKATDEEVAEVKAEDKFASINEGDYVKITDKLCGHRFEIGEIVKIAGKSSIDFTAEKLDGSTSWYVSVSEIEKIDANEAEKFAKWASIGRKPNEFKEGDIVRLTEDSGANEEGEIVEIAEDGAHFYFDECGDKYGSEASWFELVSPVEARFDRQ